MRYFVLDIEADALKNPKNIWCVCVEDLYSNKCYEFTDREQFFYWYDVHYPVKFIGHNAIEYDIPVLRKLWGIKIEDEDIIDTLILSRLYSPKLEGGHSLESWGNRLNYPKMEYSDFSCFSPEMLEYCKNDVKLTKLLYKTLMEKVGKWGDAIRIEHSIACALRDASDHGFYFNVAEALNLRKELDEERSTLDVLIQAAYPPTFTGKRVIKEVPFNPNSAKQVIDKLWEAGWKPVDKTDGAKDYRGNEEKKLERFKRYGWKLNEVNLATLPNDAPEAAKSILKRTIYETRIRKLDEWLNLVDDDSAIHGRVIGLGTWTHRMSHQNPNLANISAKKSIKYRTEELNKLATDLGGRMRGLWLARPGRVLVGTDAEGIQLRVLAHYMEDEEFVKAVTEGNKDEGTDPHSFNQRRIGLGTRDNAKTFIYAFLLGGGDAKLGEIYGLNRTQGAALKIRYVESTPGLKRLKGERIPSDAARGFTIAFDGRQIQCDSTHLMMAAYLQGGEAIIMKLAVVLALEEIRFQRIPECYLINVVHDEMIFECLPEDAKNVKAITEWSIKAAGEKLKLKCPMKGEGKIGRTWLNVH